MNTFEKDEETSKSLFRYRRIAEEKEGNTLHRYAAFSKDHERYLGKEDDHRMPYKRDVDRIIHSKAYARYVDKTQVVYLVDNDHITHRSLHVQLVSNFARGIAEILHLNIDLVEAIALGHDVGHPPFGHEGETYLCALSEEYGNGAFAHPLQSCRLFSEIEPLNLGLTVYDGFLCHDGGMREHKIVPEFGKTWESHFADQQRKKQDPNANIAPMSLEGCLVKLCDTLSYIGKDIEDAISIGILSREEVPKTLLGNTNRKILSILAQDVIETSYEKDFVAVSEPVFEMLKELRAFNFKHIYNHPKLKVESEKIKRSYRILFETLHKDFEENGSKSALSKQFLTSKPEKYLDQTTSVQKVVDYISGMTDGYFVKMLGKLVVPSQIEL